MAHFSVDLRSTVEKLFDHLMSTIIAQIIANGAKALLVGGAVRDIFLNITVKDIDIEVYGLSLEDLENILKQFGVVRYVGKAFGVLRIDGCDVDWSVARSDNAGRKPSVTFDPHMSYAQSFKRRDLTINTLAIDLNTYELIDHYNGLQDLHNKILRAPDLELFVQDPLRLFRVMQFIGRFDMQPDDALNEVCRTMDISTVSKERIHQECTKLITQSVYPSRGIRWLQSLSQLEKCMPEIFALVDLPQRSDYHPEGDVFEHSMQALDAAAQIARTYDDDHQKLVLLYAALCHDMGKAVTTINQNGVWRSPGHAQAGVSIARTFLKRIDVKEKIIQSVCKLVQHHMAIGEFIRGKARVCRYKHLAEKLSPDTHLQMLCWVSMADRQGRNKQLHKPLTALDPEVIAFEKMCIKAGVLCAPEKPLINAQDLLTTLQPGPHIGRLLKQAYILQLDEHITDKNILLKKVL